MVAGLARGQPQQPLTLEQAVCEAIAKSAELASLQHQVTAAQAMVAPAGALPDPMLSAGLSNIPVGAGIRLDQDPMSSLQFMASQEVPRGAKRRLSRQVQADMADMLQARYQDERNDLVRKVKQAYYDLQERDQEITIAEQNRDLAQDMLAAAEARYSTGKVMQQDVFQAQVRLSQMLDMLVSARREREAAQSRLNRLLYRPAGQPIPALPPLSATPFSSVAAELAPRADEQNPKLQEMRIRVRQADSSERLAAQGIKPDLRFDVAYMIRKPTAMEPMGGDDMWSAAVGINLPWLYRRQKVDQEVKAAQATRAAAEQDVQSMSNELAAMIEETVIMVQRAEQELSLVETGLLPQAEGAVAASRATYATGQGDILSLLDNQMNFYNLQLQRIMLLRDHEQGLAELEYLVGGRLAGGEVGGG
jgi:outer membrane protein TolC